MVRARTTAVTPTGTIWVFLVNMRLSWFGNDGCKLKVSIFCCCFGCFFSFDNSWIFSQISSPGYNDCHYRDDARSNGPKTKKLLWLVFTDIQHSQSDNVNLLQLKSDCPDNQDIEPSSDQAKSAHSYHRYLGTVEGDLQGTFQGSDPSKVLEGRDSSKIASKRTFKGTFKGPDPSKVAWLRPRYLCVKYVPKLRTRATLGWDICEVCTEAVHSVAL